MKKIITTVLLMFLAIGILGQSANAQCPRAKDKPDCPALENKNWNCPSACKSYKEGWKTEKYEPKDFSYLFNKIEGLSENQLKQHNTLYLGYVDKFNALVDERKDFELDDDDEAYSEYRALNLAITYNHNGAYLHELYFGNLTADQELAPAKLKEILAEHFGSYEAYIEDLTKAGQKSRGWVITGLNKKNGRLYNFIVDSHDLHLPVGVMPVLVMDVWEHAYMVDYGINRDAYIATFLNNVDWSKVLKRITYKYSKMKCKCDVKYENEKTEACPSMVE